MPRLILNSVNTVKKVVVAGRPVAAGIRAAARRIVNSFDTKHIQNMVEFFNQYNPLVTPGTGAVLLVFARKIEMLVPVSRGLIDRRSNASS